MTTSDLMTATLAALRGMDGFANSVYEARTTEFATADLPAFNAFQPAAKVTPSGPGLGLWTREQTLSIVAEFTAKSDAALAAAGRALETAIWNALLGSPEWCACWEEIKSWASECGRDGEYEVRRGILRIVVVGTWRQEPPDPSDMTPLREIRMQMAMDGSADNPVAERRVECDGAEDEEG